MVYCRLRPIKVALISEEYPPYHLGGVGTYCHNLAGMLSGRGVSTLVVAGRSNKLTRERINDNLEVVRLPYLNFPPRFVWFQLQSFSKVSRLLEGCDVLHSISPEVSPVCAYLKRTLKKPLVTSYHGVTRNEMLSFINSPFSTWTKKDFSFHVAGFPLYDASNRISIAQSDHIISCSYAVLEELRSDYKELDLRKASVIYNGVDLSDIENVGNSLKMRENSNDLTLIHYGRLMWAKGAIYAINAFKLLIREFPTLTLKIFGRGPLENKIRFLASDPQTNGRIHVLGQIPHAKLLEEIVKSDVAVLPSLREAQPISVLEAMACKKPVVAWDLPFVSEYLTDSVNGVLAKALDLEDLAAKIRMLLTSKRLREQIGKTAYEYVQQNHNWNDIIKKYIEVYNKVAYAS